jgi:tetratricopeptide (TPR) repeat protein
MSLRAAFIAFLCLIGNLSWSLPALASTPANGESIYAFGYHLLELGDHYRAITELKRFSLLFPDHPKQPAAQILLGLAYEASADYDSATNYFRRLQQTENDSDIHRLALYKLGEIRLRQRQYQQATQIFQRFLTQFPDGSLVDRTTYLLGLTQTLEGKPQAAKRLFGSFSPDSPWKDRANALQQTIDFTEPRPYKSPRTAGILAGILPGAGHLYLGKPRHAITALLLNGIFIAGATFSFLEGLEATGVILLYFETGWYLGNIKSAREEAHEFNRQQLQDLQNQLYKTYVPPEITIKQLPGLNLNIAF